LIQEVLDLYRDNGVKVRINMQLDTDRSCIEGDTGRLRQLLHNLVKNAQEAVADIPDACITITTRSGEDAQRPYIDLFVDDNGPGFLPGILDNLFEPYVSTKRKGSGLGLAG
jgi:C4-dicarboxylate-specific signal transduction histidine kinase